MEKNKVNETAPRQCNCKCHNNTDHWKQCSDCYTKECVWYKDHPDIWVLHAEAFLRAIFGKQEGNNEWANTINHYNTCLNRSQS